VLEIVLVITPVNNTAGANLLLLLAAAAWVPGTWTPPHQSMPSTHHIYIYPVSLFLSGDDYYLQCLWSQSELKSFDSVLSQRSATGSFGSVKCFLKLPSFVSNTPLSLNQNRPSGVCRNDQFGADQGEERRGEKGLKKFPPSPNFCL
jgi:hypothetical protein